MADEIEINLSPKRKDNKAYFVKRKKLEVQLSTC